MMSLVFGFWLSGAMASTPTYPSGFHPSECAPLLSGDASVPSLTAFARLTVRDKVRDVHALAYALYTLIGHSPGEDLQGILLERLDAPTFKSFGPRLRTLTKVSRAHLAPYAGELLDISYEISGLAAEADAWDLSFNSDLWAYFVKVTELVHGGDQRAHDLRAFAFLNLASIESELGRRSAAPKDLLLGSLNRLEQAAIEDGLGRRKAVALTGLPQVLANLWSAESELSTDDCASIDRAAARLVTSHFKPFAPGVPRPSYFEEVAEVLGMLSRAVLADQLPCLSEALGDVVRRFAPTAPTHKLN